MKRRKGNTRSDIGRSGRLIAMVLAWLTVLPPAMSYSDQSEVSQFGITWTFDRDYVVGQFSNGDYWVVGPVTIVGINPASVESAGRWINGSMINPSPRLVRKQGYDSAMYGRYAQPGDYEAGLNVARPNNQDLSRDNPLIVNPDSSLVSTISTPESDGRTQLKTAAILTVLDSAVPKGSFRPPYCGSDKTVRFYRKKLDYSSLASLKPVPGVPLLSTVERYFERPWLDHIPLWMAGAQHPADNMPNYGREIGTQVGIGAIMLNLNFTDQRKETLLVRYVQLGIDLYGIIQDGGAGNWIGMGGHANGRKFPILFAGLVLGDPDMTNIGKRSGDCLYSEGHGPANKPPDYIHFGEDDQTFYVAQADVDVTHSSQWNPDYRDTQRIPYESEDIGLPEWGIVHSTEPQNSNKFWDTAYRNVSSPCWGGMVLAAHIMGMKDIWNHDALFDYKDRYMQAAVERRQTDRFIEGMWDAYRADYGPVWTMVPTLTVDAAGGSVSKVPDREAYTFGTRVRLRAVADPGYKFSGWSGGLVGDENPTAIIMHANRSITANFVPIGQAPDKKDDKSS
jgi:hypothetical protein